MYDFDNFGASDDREGAVPAQVHKSVSVPRYRIYILGPTRIERNGTPIELSTNLDVYALLSLLCSRLGRPVLRREARRFLWSGLSDEVAEEHLRETLNQLRLGFNAYSPMIPVKSDQVSLQLSLGPNLWLDAAELIDAATDEDELRRARAIALYRGEPFVDFPYDSWALLPREYLRDVFVGLARVEAEKLCKRGNSNRAADLLAATLEAEPFEEDIYREAIAVNFSIGRIETAMRQAQRCRNTLANLGLAPSEAFITLERRLERKPRFTKYDP